MPAGVAAMQTREWSSRMFKISTSVPSASRQWVMSACQRSLGWSAQNVRHDDRGRFCGCGVTNPRRDRIRQIVETAGTGYRRPACRARWAAMVSAPGVQALLGQRLAQPHDLVLDLQADRARVGVRPPGPRLERRLALRARSGGPAVCTQNRETP